MAATDPQSLLSQASCFSCYANSPGMVALLELALLAQIASAGGVGGGVSELVAGTNITLSPSSGVGVVTVNSSGGGGGGGQLIRYTSGTPANPTDTTQPAIAYDPTGVLPTLGWNSGTLSWE